MSERTDGKIDWPDQEAEDAYWDRAYNEYVQALFVRDDRYAADIDRSMLTLSHQEQRR